MGVLITDPTPKMLRLRALVEQAEAKSHPCAWCEAVARGVLDSTAIPKPSASMCLEHQALSVRWSRWFAKAQWNAPSIMSEIVSEGVEIAKRAERMAA